MGGLDLSMAQGGVISEWDHDPRSLGTCDEIKQGSLNDCFLVAAHDAVCPRVPIDEYIRENTIENGTSPGTKYYEVKLHDPETLEPRWEAIDSTYKPVDNNGTIEHFYANPKSTGLLEKAFIKQFTRTQDAVCTHDPDGVLGNRLRQDGIHPEGDWLCTKRGYDLLSYGSAYKALTMLTGENFKNVETPDFRDADTAAKFLLVNSNKEGPQGSMVAGGWDRGGTAQHAYSIRGVSTTANRLSEVNQDNVFLNLKNPKAVPASDQMLFDKPISVREYLGDRDDTSDNPGRFLMTMVHEDTWDTLIGTPENAQKFTSYFGDSNHNFTSLMSDFDLTDQLRSDPDAVE